MPRRSSGREDFEEEVYYSDYPSRPRRRDRAPREHVYEEDLEYRKHAHAPRLREMERSREQDFTERYHRSSSAGPLVVRPRLSDEYVHVPRATEREIEEVRISHPKHRRSPSPRYERDELMIRRGEKPKPKFQERDEILIREDERFARPPRRRTVDHEHELEVDIDHGSHKHEFVFGSNSRERDRPRQRPNEREDIRIQTGDRRPRGRGVDREEIMISRERDRSSSSESSIAAPPSVHAPPIHQDVITHHKHVEHGYEPVRPRPRAPEVPRQVPRRGEIDEIDIRERHRENGRTIDDLEIIHRHESSSPSPPRPHKDELIISHTTGREPERRRPQDVLVFRDRDTDRDRGLRDPDVAAEANYYNRRATAGAPMGEAYNGATRDWSIVDVPPGTKRVTMDGAGGGSQEISWQRYNGVRRSKFVSEGEGYGSDREFEPERERGKVGRRYIGVGKKKDRLWTEITKDLVVKEAIEKAGYEYEETEYFYYVFSHLRYDDVSHLVRISDDYRRARRDRVRELEHERAHLPPPLPIPPPAPALPAASSSTTKLLIDRGVREREDFSEHDILVDAGRRYHTTGRRW